MPGPPVRKWYQDMTVGRAVLLILFTPIAIFGWIIAAFFGVMAVHAFWHIPEFLTSIAPAVGYLMMIAIAWYAVWRGWDWLLDKYDWLSKLAGND